MLGISSVRIKENQGDQIVVMTQGGTVNNMQPVVPY
jgi:hypothetical protein